MAHHVGEHYLVSDRTIIETSDSYEGVHSLDDALVVPTRRISQQLTPAVRPMIGEDHHDCLLVDRAGEVEEKRPLARHLLEQQVPPCLVIDARPSKNNARPLLA